MEVMKLWFHTGAVWEIILVSVLGIGAGILIGQRLPKAKLMAFFVPLLVFLYAEYKVQLHPDAAIWAIIGGIAAAVGLGGLLPSALIKWEFKGDWLKGEDDAK